MVYDLIGNGLANPLLVIRRYTMETYKQLSHTTYLCNYHVVFSPKYRFRILHGIVGQKVRDWVRKIAEWKSVEILEGHVSKDHVHLVLSIPPKYAVSDVVGTIKGRVAIRLFKHVPEDTQKVLGPKILVTRLLRQHDRSRRGHYPAICSETRSQRASGRANGL
jgi:putative transposase